MTRILFLDQYGDMGGGQTSLLSMLVAARETGAQVTVLAPAGGALESAIHAEFDGTVAFSHCAEPRLTHGRKSFSDIMKLMAYGVAFRRHLPLLRQQNVIYVNGLRHLPHLLLLTPFLRARIIYHLHLRHSRLEKMLLRLAARAAGTFRLVANSRFTAEDFGDHAKLVMIENALDPRFAGLSFTDRFTTRPGWTAAVTGTLRPEKGQDIAVAAIPKDMTLHVIGRDGDGADTWIAALKQAAGNNTYFDGEAVDVPAALDAAGVQFGLVPSRVRESFGLAAIENMACSCLTIVSGKGGLAEIAEKTGALVAPDATALALLLNQLCTRPRAELAEMARAQFMATQRHYAPARFQTEVLALLKQALAACDNPGKSALSLKGRLL